MTQPDLAENPAVAIPGVVVVRGEVMRALPQDLYIPPDALCVLLETFQGPLDLLLYLIKKQNIDILDIPIKEITIQYMQYVELMRELHLDVAAEYLLMAAMLAEIKSRMLLPRSISDHEDDAVADPRAELIRRLQQYECFKKAAHNIDTLQQVDRDIFVANAVAPPMNVIVASPEVPMQDLLDALVSVMTRARLFADHTVERQLLSIRERMVKILDRLNTAEFVPFSAFFTVTEGRMGVVVTLIALLELMRQFVVDIVQNEPYGNIYVKRKGDMQSFEGVSDDS